MAKNDPELFKSIYDKEAPACSVEPEEIEALEDADEFSEPSNDDQTLRIPVSQVPPFGIEIKPHLKKA